jgi:Transposase DDE domain group 1
MGCYHPLLLFNREGDCLAAKLRPGNVHSAAGWEELLMPEIERQQRQGREIVFRADAAFAKPETLRGPRRAAREVRDPPSG